MNVPVMSVKHKLTAMNNLTKLNLLEQYISENGYSRQFTVPFLPEKSTVELQNWSDYQDLKKGIITFRQSGIRVKAPDYYPCLTNIPNIPVIFDKDNYRYLNKEELLSLQSFPTDYKFPSNYSLTKIASLLGNSANIEVIKHFVKQNYGMNYNLSFIDLFSGIGAFHQVFNGNCILAIDKNKSCQEVYQMNFPTTSFLLGDINSKEIQKKIIATEFELLCAGFPCQNFSKAGKQTHQSKELTSLLTIIRKKQPNYLLLENVPQFLNSFALGKLVKELPRYSVNFQIINPKNLGIKQKRPRLFIWGQRNNF